ncbi:MAG: LuxR C-terminal-related transcriptional regulator [Acidimicrobiia bacterium]
MDSDALSVVREALNRQDWSAALAAANASAVSTPIEHAERDDLLASASWWLGRLDECIDARERAYRAYDELGEDRRAGQCAVWLWEHHGMRGRPSAAAGWLRRARRSLEAEPDSVEHAALLLREAEVAHGRGDLDVALDLGQRVIALGRELRAPDIEAEALQTAARVLIDQGRVDEGMAHLDEAMLFAVEGRLGPYSTGKVYCSLISACEQLGDLDRASEWTDATLRWSQRHPFAIFPGICRVHRAVVLKRRGALNDAEHEAIRACDELVGSHLGNTASAYAQVGDIRRRLGDLAGAEVAFDRARELCGRPCGDVALLRLAQGRTDAALAVVTECLEQTPTNRLARAELLPVLVHVAIAADDLDRADGANAELEQITEVFDTPMLRAVLCSTRGRLLLAHHDAAAARAALLDALDRWQMLRVPYEEATTRTLLGEALRQSGEAKAANASFSAAAALFEHIGAQLDARQVTDGARVPHPDGLTDREIEVLRLVATGKTNSEIASDLYLSVKTVSRHLSNIFTKIGVSSRSSATAYAFEHGFVAVNR